MDWTIIILGALVMVLGSLVQGVVGFGANLLGAPLLFLISPAFVPVPLLAAGIIRAILVLSRDHEGISRFEVTQLMGGIIPGTLIGAFVGGLLSKSEIGLLASIFVLIGIGLSVRGFAVPKTTAAVALVGGFSGLMQVTVGIGGPPLALLFQRSPAKTVRANMGAVFVVSGIFSLLSISMFGHIRFSSEWVLALALIAGSVIGIMISSLLTPYVDGSHFRTILLIFSGLSAAVLFFSNILRVL